MWNPGRYLHSALLLSSAVAFTACSIPPKNREGERVDRRKTAGWFRRLFSIMQLFMGIVEASIIISSLYHAPFPRLPLIKSPYIDGGGDLAPRLALTPIRIVGIIFIFIGSFIRLQSMKSLGKFFTPQTDMRIQMDHRLITAFPYSLVRHPAYSAPILLSHYGCLMCSFTKGAWASESGVRSTKLGAVFFGAYALALALFSVVVLWKMLEEDRMMKRQFGKEWEVWARKVRYMVIPGVL